MSQSIRRAVITALALICMTAALRPSAAIAQDVSIPSLKAAFLMNFVKFAEWPAGSVPAGRPFAFCVIGDKAVFKELEASITRNSRPDLMSVSEMPADGAVHACQLIYLGGSDLAAPRRVLGALQNAPVFTASDVRGFAEAGGIVELRLEKAKMRLWINPAAAQRARIALSAKLLSLATLVKEPSHDGR